ncbi:MAG: D-alanine--D-alanine ligase [Bacteroidales bacterium]|nr:D-alanine--D-alanine ligase [Bacteroidales bacterium]
MKKTIALVMGGYSGEHDISIASGNQVYEQLDKAKYDVYKVVIDRQGWSWLDGEERRDINRGDFTIEVAGRRVRFDLAFIIIHGNPGENGVLQGYFDMLGIPYTTCGFYTSSLTFHKGYCNPVVKSFGLVSVANSVLLYRIPPEEKLRELVSPLRYPLFVKPAAGGSSVATTKVKSEAELLPALELAFTEGREVLVEECISGREFDCGVFSDGRQKIVFPVTEIIPTGEHEFFDYAAKYDGFSREVTPAEVDEAVAKHIQKVSKRLYDLLGCRGVVRFDYIYDTEKQELYFLEVNTVPGQSAESIVPKQARAIGISPAELYEMVITAAFEAAKDDE